MDLYYIGYRLFLFFGPFLFALCVHEYAHGLVAKWRGDNTAELMGRLNLNPISHMDMVGTLMLPILTIVAGSPISVGWAKPVPVNTRNLKKPRTDMFWIAIAGPLSNILMAIATLILLRFFAGQLLGNAYRDAILGLAVNFVGINVVLFIFNMIPVHPLDGGKVLARFLPTRANQFLEENEMHFSWLLLVVMIFGGRYIVGAAGSVTEFLAFVIGVRF
jgi:Zn-dependent protease